MGFDMEGCKKAVFNTSNQGEEGGREGGREGRREGGRDDEKGVSLFLSS